MKKLVWGWILGGALFAPVANADTIEEAIGNTVVIQLADGSIERYYLNADRTFTAALGDEEINGTWSLNGGEICIDIGDGEPVCEDYPKGKKAGDSWTEIDDDDGTTLTISIEPGR